MGLDQYLYIETFIKDYPINLPSLPEKYNFNVGTGCTVKKLFYQWRKFHILDEIIRNYTSDSGYIDEIDLIIKDLDNYIKNPELIKKQDCDIDDDMVLKEIKTTKKIFQRVKHHQENDDCIFSYDTWY